MVEKAFAHPATRVVEERSKARKLADGDHRRQSIFHCGAKTTSASRQRPGRYGGMGSTRPSRRFLRRSNDEVMETAIRPP